MDEICESNALNLIKYDTFESMNLSENILKGIYSYGFEKPSTIQQTGITQIMTKKDIICQSQSGTGKTATFLIGILQNINEQVQGTQCIILSPTRELAEQTYNVAIKLSKYTKIVIEKCIGGTFINNNYNIYNNAQIIIGTPGRIYDMTKKKFINYDNICHLVLDEADEMLSKEFLEQIKNILYFFNKTTQICLISATMSPEIHEITSNFMNNPIKLLVKTEELTLEGIHQYYINTEEERWKFDILCDLYESININQAIIYCNTKRKVDWLYDKLIDNNFTCSVIHGEIGNHDRKNIMNNFRNGTIRILITTDLLSRGIDVQQVSLVVNYDVPLRKECYIHRIGRSGRYGRKGVALNFVTNSDFNLLNDIKEYYTTDIEALPENINEVFSI
jgi:superfamily II DNA/RNA helicase